NKKSKKRRATDRSSLLTRWLRAQLLLGGVGGLLLALVPVVLLLELLDAARRVDVLHLPGEERVARRADFHRDVLARAAGHELVAAAARDCRLDVLRMNPRFHDNSCLSQTAPNPYSRRPSRRWTRGELGGAAGFGAYQGRLFEHLAGLLGVVGRNSQ